jgi:hypothetical protein
VLVPHAHLLLASPDLLTISTNVREEETSASSYKKKNAPHSANKDNSVSLQPFKLSNTLFRKCNFLRSRKSANLP